MSCQLKDRRPDWKAYALGELEPSARREAELHASACSDCQEELAGLRVTLDALATLREEEIPRRIAFVSDKVFEPRWWRRLSETFLRPSFGAGAVIAAAIVFHAYIRPAAAPAPAPVDTAAIEARVAAQVSQRIEAQMAAAVNTAVAAAVAQTKEQDDRRTAALLAATERRYADAAEFLDRQVTRMYAMNTGAGVR